MSDPSPGHSSERSLPRLTYAGLDDAGKTVHLVDPSADRIEGDETAAWVERVAV